MTYDEFIRRWESNHKQNQRLGQFFCNTYVKTPEPELFYCGPLHDLFYEVEERAAKAAIIDYLKQYQYWPNMPEPLANAKGV